MRFDVSMGVVEFEVNGLPRKVDADPERLLLHVLREDLDLTGTKYGCGEGRCGSCTVLLDGVPVCACLVAAGQAAGREIVTVEGLPKPDAGGVVAQAFLAAGAVQCGFCTPGFVVAVHDLLSRRSDPCDADVREALAGNLCRCTGYEAILDAVRAAATEVRTQ